MEGKWNGGFAPYGYSLIDGKLEVNEDKHCQRRKTDLENHLYKTYDRIDDAE